MPTNLFISAISLPKKSCVNVELYCSWSLPVNLIFFSIPIAPPTPPDITKDGIVGTPTDFSLL